MSVDTPAEKLTIGEPLSTEQLLEVLPALKEVPAALLKQFGAGAAVRREFSAGDVVCEEGEFGSTAFYIVSGHVEIFIGNPLAHVRTRPRGWGITSLLKRMRSMLVTSADDSAHDDAARGFIPIDASVDLPRTTPIAFLGPGELFGEMTCRTFQPRSATVRATEKCVMVEMLRVILDMLVGTRDPDAETKAATKVRAPTFKGTSFKKQMDEQYRERSLVAHLRGVPLFATLDLEFFNYLREHAELISCNKGQVICKQGDPADAFYLIRTGLVRVAQELPGGEIVRTYLKKGEYFGEIGLLTDQARNANCSALDAVDLVRIGKADFALMMEKFPIVRATLERVAKVRIEMDKERKVPSGLQLDEFLNQGLFEAQNLLLIDLDHCTRCDACVNACADAHEGVTRLIRDGLRYDRYLVATACRSCRDPLCMTQCPVGSIRRKESLEIIIEDWCIGCSKCAELCPYGNINMHSFEVKKEVPATEPKPAAKSAAAPAAKAPATAAKAGEAKAASAPTPKAAAAIPAVAKTDATLPAADVARGSKPIAPPAESVAPSDTPAAARSEVVSAVTSDPAGAAAKAKAAEETEAKATAAAGGDQPARTDTKAPAAPADAGGTPGPANPPAATNTVGQSAAAKPSAAAKSPAATPAKSAPAKPDAKKKMVKKKVTVSKATTCDLCTQLSVPSCVYACPHEAAMRVDPTKFLAEQIGMRGERGKRRRGWLRRGTDDRTTH